MFLNDEEKRAEYVMNEKGVIYNGAYNYISSMKWDYGQVGTAGGGGLPWDRGQVDRSAQASFSLLQFEDKMVDICLKLLDMNHKHKQDPAKDVSARGNPVYVGRLVSAMVGLGPGRAAGRRRCAQTGESSCRSIVKTTTVSWRDSGVDRTWGGWSRPTGAAATTS